MQSNLIEYFENGALKNCPNYVAVLDGEKNYSFHDIAIFSKNLSQIITNNVIENNQLVAVLLPKSTEIIVSDLAILYSGNFYTNLDLKAPKERLEKLLSNLSPKLIITDEAGNSLLKKIDIKIKTLVDISDSMKTDKLYDQNKINEALKTSIDVNPACIINTSGSTGVPKSVVLNHKSTIDFIDWCLDNFDFNNDDVIGSLSPFYFDIYTLELFISLSKGCTISIINENKAAFPVELVKSLNDTKTTFIFWVPTVMVNIANQDILSNFNLNNLRRVFFAGEVFPTKQLNYWRDKLPDTQFVNLYGPIEITVDCTYHILTRKFKDDEPIPIGIPCKNTEILILNENNELVADGEIGELCVRGSSLALGYYNNTEQTQKVFTQNPLNSSFIDKIYRTGDLAYVNDYGEIMFSGRKDFQIKHMGYRIELAEIETAVMSLDIIKNSCVLYNQENKEIVLIYESQEELVASKIRNQLSSKIPKYMMPTKFHRVDIMPRNPNGKIDRQELKNNFL